MLDYSAIIFDMDGTLVDSLNVWTEADRRFVQSFGLAYDEKVSYAMKTMHFAEACRYLIDEFSLDITEEEAGAAVMEHVKHGYLNEVELKPYALQYLEKEHKKGVKLCIATSNDKALAAALTKKLGISDFFEFILTSDEVGSSKDNPAIFLESAKRLGSTPSKTLVFEDSVHAAKSAALAGFYVVGVYDEFSAHEFDLLKEISDKVIVGFEELI